MEAMISIYLIQFYVWKYYYNDYLFGKIISWVTFLISQQTTEISDFFSVDGI